MFTVRGFNDVDVGHTFSHSVTVTEAHLVLAAGLFGDFHPLHTNEEYARQSRFGHRITHGPLNVGIMASVLGNYFAGAAGPYLEQVVRFKGPVAPGDTVTTTWKIVEKIPKAKLEGGIIRLEVQMHNQDKVLILEGEGKIILYNDARPR
ncbi:MAG: MaoC family dehydratase [Anaerolineae bacterium]